MAAIKVIQGPDKGRAFSLGDDETIIGRESETAQLNDGTVSRRHVRLWTEEGRWMLEDLGSANGTFLNGMRVSKAIPLNRGDQIRCGSTLLIFQAGTSPTIDVDESGQLVDAAIVATVQSSDDSVIIPTPEAGVQAIGNLRILYDLIQDVGSILNTDLLLRRTLDKIAEIVPADRGYIILINEDGSLEPKASRFSNEGPDQKLPISRTILNEVVKKEIGILSSNAMSDKRFTSGKSVHDFGIRSALCVPIKGRDRALGVIHVDCGVSEHTYTTEQLRLLTAIGSQTGLAIENVRLYESTLKSERLAAVGETVAVLSHHIKNILQALDAGIDVVEMGLDENNLDKAKDAWPIVDRSLGRINELILNMLTFSKDREPLQENISLNQVLSECAELIRARAEERDIAVLSDYDTLPAIPGDSAGLSQAFLNLLTNALDAVDNETGAITVGTEYQRSGKNVIATISDNGIGIEPEHLTEIFTPFYSAKGQKGTGLGLAVAKKIFEEHHGKIEVESKVGEGTTFTITLPALEEPRDSHETLVPIG